jgi:hypothetical protein
MKTVITLIALLILNTLSANDIVMTVDSNIADYNGKMISLNGHVIVEHELGKITADNVEISAEEADSPSNSHFLTMKDNVNISLKDGGVLSCAFAEIDYNTLEGHFHSNEKQEYVVYTEKKSDKSSAPLVLKSRQMVVEIAKGDIKTEKPSCRFINAIFANNQVTVNYQNDFTAAADYATYQRLEPTNESDSSKQMTGLIALRAENEGGQCQVMTRRGDLIKSSHICIDTIKRQLLFAYPKGALSPSQGQQRIDFSSDTLIWDAKENILTLRDNVIVNQQGLGILTNDKEIQITQNASKTGKQLRSIEANGVTVLTFLDEERLLSHVLVCNGKALIDNQANKTFMDSPRDANGKVLENQQISFKDDMGEIFADKLTIDYTMIDDSPLPTKLFLEGHVQILGRKKVSNEDVGAFLQYAISDEAEYCPQSKELKLSATGKKRVLFYDRVNSLQISATQLKVRRDQTTNKESVQGLGDVRFSFVQQELEQMKKQFQLD